MRSRKFWVMCVTLLLSFVSLWFSKLGSGEFVAVVTLIMNGYFFANVAEKRNVSA